MFSEKTVKFLESAKTVADLKKDPKGPVKKTLIKAWGGLTLSEQKRAAFTLFARFQKGELKEGIFLWFQKNCPGIADIIQQCVMMDSAYQRYEKVCAKEGVTLPELHDAVQTDAPADEEAIQFPWEESFFSEAPRILLSVHPHFGKDAEVIDSLGLLLREHGKNVQLCLTQEHLVESLGESSRPVTLMLLGHGTYLEKGLLYHCGPFAGEPDHVVGEIAAFVKAHRQIEEVNLLSCYFGCIDQKYRPGPRTRVFRSEHPKESGRAAMVFDIPALHEPQPFDAQKSMAAKLVDVLRKRMSDRPFAVTATPAIINPYPACLPPKPAHHKGPSKEKPFTDFIATNSDHYFDPLGGKGCVDKAFQAAAAIVPGPPRVFAPLWQQGLGRSKPEHPTAEHASYCRRVTVTFNNSQKEKTGACDKAEATYTEGRLTPPI